MKKIKRKIKKNKKSQHYFIRLFNIKVSNYLYYLEKILIILMNFATQVYL